MSHLSYEDYTFLQDKDMNFTRKYIEKSIHLMHKKQDFLQYLPIPSYEH